jgi:hypothetical protein
MSASAVGYAWTFAFLLTCFVTLGLSWVIATIPDTLMPGRVTAGVVLVGCAVVIVKTLVQMIDFDRRRFSKSIVNGQSNGTHVLKSYITTSCPDYSERSIDERNKSVVCSNVLGDTIVGSSPRHSVMNLSDVDVDGTCVDILRGSNDRPWMAMQKYCEYAGFR